MKTAITFIFLLGLSSAFYINRFQRKWKADDSDEKGLQRTYLATTFTEMCMCSHILNIYRNYAKGGDSSEEDSSEESESSHVPVNGNKADSEEAEAAGTEGNGGGEEADSEGEEENGGASAPEVESTATSNNGTESENGEQTSTPENSNEVEPTETSTFEASTEQPKTTNGEVTAVPASSDYESLGNEEGSNGGISSTAVYETAYVRYETSEPAYDTAGNGDPYGNGQEYEHGQDYGHGQEYGHGQDYGHGQEYGNGYGYEKGPDYRNEVDPRIRGDNFARYEDEYSYSNRVYDRYGREYEYYQ